MVVRMRAPGKRERRDGRSAVLSGWSTPQPLGAPVGSGWKCASAHPETTLTGGHIVANLIMAGQEEGEMTLAEWLEPDGIEIIKAAIAGPTLVLAVIGFIHGQRVYREQKTRETNELARRN